MLRLEGLLSTDLNLIRNMKVIPKFPIAEPHMLLAMPISPMLKLEIARHRADDEMRRVRSKKMIPYTYVLFWCVCFFFSYSFGHTDTRADTITPTTSQTPLQKDYAWASFLQTFE